MLKVSSTSTMFVTITGTLTPASVNTGAAAAGTACLRSMRRLEMPFESAVRTNSSCRTSRIELFIIRSQTAASGRPTTIHGTIIEPSQRSGLSSNGTYLTGMNPMPVTAMPAPKSSSTDSPTT